MIAGQDASVTGEGQEWSATRLIENHITEGRISYSINFEDEIGNVAQEVTQNSNAIDLFLDKTPPSGSLGKIFSEWNSNDNRTQTRLTLSASDNTSSEH